MNYFCMDNLAKTTTTRTTTTTMRQLFLYIFILISIAATSAQTIFRIQDETQLLHLPELNDDYFQSSNASIDELYDITNRMPGNSVAYMQLCYKLKREERHDEAMEAIKQAMKFNPTNKDLINLAGAILLHNHQYNDLEKICQVAVSKDPKLADAYNILGIIAQEKGENAKAIYHFNHALSIKKKKYNAIKFNLANAERSSKNYAEAIKLYQNSLKKFMADKNFVSAKNFRFHQPNKAWVYNNIGLTLTMAGEYENALSEYRKSLSYSKNPARTYNGMACTHYELGQPDSSIKYLNMAIEASPKYASPYKNLGNVYYEQGKYEKALSFYEKAYDLDKDDEWLLCKLASTLKNLKRYEEAISYFSKATQIDKTDHEAYYQLGLCYHRLENTPLAQENFKKAERLGSKTAKGWIRK